MKELFICIARGIHGRLSRRSAFYLSLLYPELEIVKEGSQNTTRIFVCIPDDYLIEIFDVNQIFVGNEYIEMKVPEKDLRQKRRVYSMV